MSERCPLKSGMYWDNEEKGRIPEVCENQCEGIWGTVTEKSEPSFDMFDPDCTHDAEYGGTSLQRPYLNTSSLRLVGILSVCTETGDDVFAETYSFECPFEKVN